MTREKIVDDISAVIAKLTQLQSDIVAGNLHYVRSSISGITTKTITLEIDIEKLMKEGL